MVKQLLEPALKHWASGHGIAGMWIEDRAVDLAYVWAVQPESRKSPGIALSVQTDPLMDRFREFHLTIPIPHEFRFERPYFKPRQLKEYLKSKLVEAFDAEFERFLKTAIDSGAINKTMLPGDLQTKMEVTALYLFRGLSPEEIASKPGYARDRTVLNRWIVEVSKLLDLETVRLSRLSVPRRSSQGSSLR